jgi:TonB family protein
MIKRCPTCQRTYSDESISFCLADGALLSAPYDSPAAEPPPTEKLNSPRVEVPPTQPPRPAASTMTSLPGAQKYQAAGIAEPRRKGWKLWWVALALATLTTAVIIAFDIRSEVNKEANRIASAPAQVSPAQPSPVQASPAQASPAQAATKPTATPLTDFTKSAPQPTLVNPDKAKYPDIGAAQAQLDPDPVLFPPNVKQPSAQNTSSEDYNRIFSGREVTSKARILSKPDPTYTEEARQNQITGTVVLRVVMSASGEVTNIHAVSSLPYGLTERAIAAAKQVKFVPATKDGHPVSMWIELQYNFNLY